MSLNAAMLINPPPYVPQGQDIVFPPGTAMSYDGGTWGLYVNKSLSRSWVAYRLAKGGSKIVPMGGVRHVKMDMSRIDAYVKQRQIDTCFDCDEE